MKLICNCFDCGNEKPRTLSTVFFVFYVLYSTLFKFGGGLISACKLFWRDPLSFLVVVSSSLRNDFLIHEYSI